jgi:glycosyltransferase involved in cell wall biosynthesis
VFQSEEGKNDSNYAICLAKMSRPTILYISFGTELYGAEQCLLLLLQRLSRKGYHSVVAVPRPGPLTEQLEALGVPVVYVPFMKRWLTKAQVPGLKRFFYNPYQVPFMIRSATALRKVIRQYQVNLVHTSTSVVFDGALAAVLANVPHVWHIHETIESGKNWRFFLGAEMARSLINRFSHRIIATSEAIRKLYLDPSHNTGKIKVIYNGVDADLYDDSVSMSTLRQKLGIPTAAKVVGMVSSAAPLKRHEDFLRAAVVVQQSVPNSFFLIVGDDWDVSEYGRAIKKLSQELGLTGRIVWLGFYKEIHEIFKAIDLLVLSSEEESFGRVLIEAMAARRPVVATKVGGIPEIVIDGVTGFLVPPRSPADLAQSIIQILRDPQLAEAMGQAGRRRVEKYFSVDQYVENIEKVYLELLKDG